MLCPNCTRTIPDQSKFCLECGSNLSSLSGESKVETDQSIGMRPTLVGGGPAGQESTPDARPFKPLADRYEVLREIGRGGFGVVYEARDKNLGRTVAVKRLLNAELHGRQGQIVIERFLREALVIASLNHRNIVQVFDREQDADGHYIVMEYIESGTLAQYLNERGPLNLPEATEIIKGICQGLAAAHRKNLVHRDIKPSNILLSLEENHFVPKIVDFGLARAGFDSTTSSSGYGMGTQFYMPPEQRRDAKGVNHTADVYAVGKTIYEILTGEIPDTVDPEKLPPPAELATVIFKCVKTRPEERYFSMEDLQRDLEKIRVGATTKAASPQSPPAKNVCPNCNHANRDDVKFCESCGTGLYRTCPECQRENSAHIKFCGSCGTDSEAFQRVQDAMQRMKAYRKENNWSRVVKEFELVSGEIRLPGARGTQLKKSLQELGTEGQRNLHRVVELKAKIEDAFETREYEAALKLIKLYQELDPSDQFIQQDSERLPLLIDEQAFRIAEAEAVRLEQAGEFASAIRVFEKYISSAGPRQFAPQVSVEIERLADAEYRRRIAELKVSVEEAVAQREYQKALALIDSFPKKEPPDPKMNYWWEDPDLEQLSNRLPRLIDEEAFQRAKEEASRLEQASDIKGAIQILEEFGNTRSGSQFASRASSKVARLRIADHRSRIDESMRRGDWATAAGHVKKLLNLVPGDSDANSKFKLCENKIYEKSFESISRKARDLEVKKDYAGAMHLFEMLMLEAPGVLEKQKLQAELRRLTEVLVHSDFASARAVLDRGGNSKDYTQRVASQRLPIWKEAAERGLPAAQWLLADCYLEGVGVEKDLSEAQRLFKLAADQNLPAAQVTLGMMYAKDSSDELTKKKGFDLVAQVAEQGLPIAQSRLGYLYLNGLGVRKNFQKAAEWFKKAADQDSISALISLGQMYFEGNGVRKDVGEALKMLIKAADAGHADSQFELAQVYHKGKLVQEDSKIAYKWYREAAENGHATSQFAVAYYLEHGLGGTTKNQAEAARWYKKSAEGGYEKAIAKLKNT